MRRCLAFLAVVALMPSMALAQEQFTVYVAAPMRDGFVDTTKNIQDSIKDINARIVKMKEFRVVPSREGADLVLTVLARGVGSEAYGARLSYSEYYNNAQLESRPIVANTFWVTTMMEVGRYKKEFTGAYTQESAYSLGAWGDCATLLTQELKAWANANVEQLRRRQARSQNP